MKTCTHCLGKGRLMVNAGTGLTKPCPKCQPQPTRKKEP